MYKIRTFSKIQNIIILFFLVAIINIILPVHFLTLLLAGVVFKAFIECIENKYWYSLIIVIITFIFIEISNGLNIGVLSVLSLFIYAFVMTRLKYSLSYGFSFTVIVTLLFYLGVFAMFSINSNVQTDFSLKLLFNYIIDIIIVSII